MPEWALPFIGPVAGGAVSGLLVLAGLRVEVKALREFIASASASALRAHTRIDDHIDRHHVSKGVTHA